ncbi:hypothetical protein HBI56_166930 [Parastagonospora nodorum]|nr:hypothetical protein HBI74_200200 [Parastagonospora nodorum]KAH5089391.1 hypothetical protein HBH72_229990 [Parastagonospora nodorum]KAH5498185.1 hypothetical protein HBI29_167320 [Parastagonospora nodorum]KAH5603512.1 hypothetical protein HBI45_118320 [Parastagonospora nodorum]KAH6014926.1 hypothetical protein HBI82_116570 [Parastagonospora nodorum]
MPRASRPCASSPSINISACTLIIPIPTRIILHPLPPNAAAAAAAAATAARTGPCAVVRRHLDMISQDHPAQISLPRRLPSEETNIFALRSLFQGI